MKQFILLVIIACLTGCFGVEPHESGLEGKPLPDFTLLLTDSITSIRSTDISRGKPIVLFFLSPSCPYCRAQTKEIIEDMDKLKNIEFYFIANANRLTDFKGFYKEYKLARYPNIIAGIDTSSAMADYFEISNVPYIAIYKKNKTLNKTFIGKIYSSQIKKGADE